MNLRRTRSFGGLAAFVAVAGFALACAKAEEPLSGPRLRARWSGADTSVFETRATAERCDTLRLIEIRAISGDTGLALALYDSGAVQPGTLPIRVPSPSDSTLPRAALALRWFSRTAVQGFQGDSGEVLLRPGGARTLSGTFHATARAISGAGRLKVEGSFDELLVGSPTRGCIPPVRDSARARSDSVAGVD
jgi:hypothetical protein